VRRVLSTEHLIELVCHVAFYNTVVRVLVPLDVDLEEDAQDNRYTLS
jgi:hypothetical protein